LATAGAVDVAAGDAVAAVLAAAGADAASVGAAEALVDVLVAAWCAASAVCHGGALHAASARTAHATPSGAARRSRDRRVAVGLRRAVVMSAS